MPFGLASAVKCITRMTKPLCSYIADNGIRHSIYTDDRNALERTLLELLAKLQIVLKILDNAGFVISAKKTDTAETVGQVKLYLGFVIDSQKMQLRVTEEKMKDIKQALEEITQELEKLIQAKKVAKAVGKLVAAEPAFGPVVQLLSRAAQAELAEATQVSWRVTMMLSKEARQSLKIMTDMLEGYNGFPIKNMATAKRLDCFIEPSKEAGKKEAPAPFLRLQDTVPRTTLAGDASVVGTCALEVGNQDSKFFTQSLLTPQEQTLSSGQRELLTVLRALQKET